MIDFSIIICTRNRADALPRCLHALTLAVQIDPSIRAEVVIVNNGSTDDTQQILERWAASSSFPVAVVVEPKPGLSHARNTAVRHAKGQIIAMTDDDCTVTSDYLFCLNEAYERDWRPTVRGGMILLGDERDLPITIKPSKDPAHYDGSIRPGGFIMGANLSFHRKVWETIGEFDTRFGAGAQIPSAEDTDFVYRAHLAGFDVIYDPSIAVVHYHGRRDLSEAKGLYAGYCRGDGALYAKHLANGSGARRFIKSVVVEAINEVIGRRVFPHLIRNFAIFRLKYTIAGMADYWRLR